METKAPFCQSCAMPMEKPEHFGTNTDGTQNKDYCIYCFKNGKFTELITMQQMIDKVGNIMKQMKIPEPQIEMTKSFIPTLKRWQNK